MARFDPASPCQMGELAAPAFGPTLFTRHVSVGSGTLPITYRTQHETGKNSHLRQGLAKSV